MRRVREVAAAAACTTLLLTSPVNATQATAQPSETAMETTAAADENGFVIEGSVLVDYVGDTTEIVIPEGVTEIGSSAFSGHEEIVSVDFPSSLEVIGAGAFYGCAGITELDLPEGLRELGSQAFGDIPGLERVYVPSTLEDAFQPFTLAASDAESAAGIEVEFAPGVARVVDHLFLNARGLREIELPETVTEIGGQAFSGSGLGTIYLSADVTSIGSNAFSNIDGTEESAFYIVGPSNSYAQQYAQENGIPFTTDDSHRHVYGAWYISQQATCEKPQLRRKECSCGAFVEEEVSPALDHDFSGQWITQKEPTYYEEGLKYRQCSRCDEREEERIPTLPFDPENRPDYTLAKIQVVDAKTTSPISGATFSIYNGNDIVCAITTDDAGSASLFAPAGAYRVCVTKDGYQPREFTYTFEAGDDELPAIGIATDSFAEGQLTVDRMTQEEIEEAGIDTSAPGNNHV